MKNTVAKQVQVNIPYRMLGDGYLQKFLDYGLNPEVGLDASVLDQITPAEAAIVADQFHCAGRTITLHGPFIDLSAGSPDTAIRKVTEKRFQQLAALVPIFKPVSVVCHTGYDHRRYWPIRDQYHKTSLEIWRPLATAVKEAGSRLMLENVYEQDPLEILPVIESLQPLKVGFCLDIGHQGVFGKAPLTEWVAVMSSCLRQLHLHDNMGSQDDHMALGEGKMDIEGLFRQLLSRNIRPVAVTLEPHEESALAPSLDYLERIWPW